MIKTIKKLKNLCYWSLETEQIDVRCVNPIPSRVWYLTLKNKYFVRINDTIFTEIENIWYKNIQIWLYMVNKNDFPNKF